MSCIYHHCVLQTKNNPVCFICSAFLPSPKPLVTTALICLQPMHVYMLSLFSCVWLCDPLDYSLPGSSVHGILQARILEWVTATPSSRDLPSPGIKPSSLTSPAQAGGFFTTHDTWEAHLQPTVLPFLEWHINGLMQYVTFSDRLLSVSSVHLRCLPVVFWLASSFLSIAE